MATIARRVREFRNQKSMTQTELATRMGQPNSHGIISLLENDKRGITPDTLFAIADALNVPIQMFFSRQELEANDHSLPSSKGIEIGHKFDALGDASQRAVMSIIDKALEGNQDYRGAAE